MLEIRPGETVAVNSIFELHGMLTQPGSVSLLHSRLSLTQSQSHSPSNPHTFYSSLLSDSDDSDLSTSDPIDELDILDLDQQQTTSSDPMFRKRKNEEEVGSTAPSVPDTAAAPAAPSRPFALPEAAARCGSMFPRHCCEVFVSVRE